MNLKIVFCFYYSDYNDVFEMLDNKVAVYGRWSTDSAPYIVGLDKFTKSFMKHQKNMVSVIGKKDAGPYTNVIGFNLREMRKNVLLTNYIPV